MKFYDKNYSLNLSNIAKLILVASISFSSSVYAMAPIDFASAPLANSTPSIIKPNLLYIMDDSGSMGRDYMPDWANANNTFELDSSYNALAYNPAVQYLPPVNFTAAGIDIATYPSQAGLSTATGANGNPKPNWQRVKRNPFRSTSTTNLENYTNSIGTFGAPNFYVTLPTEFCKKADLKDCNTQTVPSATYQFPAPIRWCNSAANANTTNTPNPAPNACQATRITGFTNLRAPAVAGGATVPIATVTFTSASSTPRVRTLRVNGQEIMRRRTGQTNSLNGLANRTRNRINDCTGGVQGNCTVSGYSATSNGATVTIFAPSPTTATPVITWSNGNLSATTTAFLAPPAVLGGRIQTTITSANNSYPYPGLAVKAPERTDCVATTCTYVEEMENYANWYAYYRVRDLMMKSSTSLAFRDVGDDFKLGYMTINNSSQRLNIDTFTTAHKAAWYSNLFASPTSGGTPLRRALSQAGRIYAKKETLGGTFTDPMEFECQQNFTLLTTDGFWNSAGGVKLDGSTMGNQDSAPALAPYYEGPSSSSNNLADTSKYYRDTDLRTAALGNCTGALGTSVCESPSGGAGGGPAPNEKQTMVTMTLGLGVDGVLAHTTDYKTAASGDFSDIKAGLKNWPRPSTNGNDITTVDDLWHAAVNGDGTYFSAKKPTELVQQLKNAIASVSVRLGGGAAAAATSLNPVSGATDFFYLTTYNTGSWTGNLQKRKLNLATLSLEPTAAACVEDVVVSSSCNAPGTVELNGDGTYSCVTPGVTDPLTCSGTLVGTDCKVSVATSCTGVLKNQATRNILFNNGGVLQPFDFNNLNAAQQTTFSPSFLFANLTQASSYSAAQIANLSGDKLVDYLKGDVTFDEGATNPDEKLFRNRQALLGDLVNSDPNYIGGPALNFSDPGYQAFKTAQSSRQAVVYVGSNDGMLHAFNADTLEELWAYVPSMVIPNMWKLADSNYANKHSFFVNGDQTVADICISNCAAAGSGNWRTILIGSLQSGGRGYYALDITNPSTPNLLWEFDANASSGDVNLGYSFGKPTITKRASDGKWVVLFTSGYNNIPDNDNFYNTSAFKTTNQYAGGDGVGRLFVVDATTGTKLNTISTNVGNTSAPSGLAQTRSVVARATQDNTTTFVYAGDLVGNLWRFNIADNTALNFATLTGPSGPQPITVSPSIGIVNDKRIVLVGTGKYLEITDLTTNGIQSLYGITDYDAITATLTNPRSSLVPQVLSVDPNNSEQRIITSNAVDLTAVRGWYVDFPDARERQNVDADFVNGVLTLATTIPESTACQPDGYSWVYDFNYKTGGTIIAGAPVGQQQGSLITGLIGLTVNGRQISGSSDSLGQFKFREKPENPAAGGFQLKRSIWREIVE